MTYFINRTLRVIAAVCVVGCGDKPGSDDGTDDSGTTAGASSEGTEGPTTGDGSTSTTTATGDDASGSSGSSGSSGETGSETSSSGDTGTDPGETTLGSSTGDDSTTGGEVCALDPCAFAGQLGGEFDDCGTVNPWDDDAAAWQAAHDCAVTAAMMERQFCLVTILQGIDSDVGQSYAAQAARSYAIVTQFSDSDPCGGGGCGPVIHEASCAGLTATMDCVVEPGNACLSCDGASDSVQVCGPE
jgi:hypothetical protein